MANLLIVAEKPSVAKSIANALGVKEKGRHEGYIEGFADYFGFTVWVTWCLGHLVQMSYPEEYDPKYAKWRLEDLPLLPEEYKYEAIPETKKQFQIVAKLMNSVGESEQDKKEKSTLSRDNKFLVPVDYVVNACDAGREGELIFKRVYDLSGSRLPVKRLWISSMEDDAIREGFANLKSGEEYKNLADASVCRAQADWLIGMNASRAYTKTYDYRLTVGRVQTPTLAMLVQRGEEIEHFQKKQYFVAHVLKDGLDAVTGHLDSRDAAERIVSACDGKDAEVTDIRRETKSIAPPKLYDLTTLQREANRLFGYTAKQTLEYAQSLYEKKLLTYPRTDSQYLTDDMADTAKAMITMIQKTLPFVPEAPFQTDVGWVLNSKKVSDHHAIIPTAEIAKLDEYSLSAAEGNILYLAANRLLCAAAPKHRYLSVKAELNCCGTLFTASGRTVSDPGWKLYEEALKKYLRADDDKEDAEDNRALPDLEKGQVLRRVECKVTEHFTQPPKPYTEDSLLAVMERAGSSEMEDDVERKGLGTPATRASIIEKLIASKYAVRKKKQILATEDGSKMIALMPEYLKSAQMTADWENRLLAMERGQTTEEAFMADIYSLIERMLSDCRALPQEERQKFSGEKGNREIGKCPVCGSPVYEGKNNFYCSNRECSFALWKENRYLSSMKKMVDRKMASDLLGKGRTHAKDFYSSKTGKNFAADLILSVSDDGKTSFRMEFPDRSSGKKKG